MYICILSSLPEENDLPYDPSPHMDGYHWYHHIVQESDVEEQVRTLMDQGVDVFVNLCDGTPDEPVSGIELVRAMEKLSAAFTGADSKFFDPTREEMKKGAARAGIPVPAYTFAKSMADVERAGRTLRFPMLVKPPHGYASFGIHRESRVTNVDDLRIQTEKAIHSYGRALIEEFIEGREFTALVAENPDDPAHPLSFKPVEFLFPPGESFKHYEMKWVEYEKMRAVPVNEPQIEQCLRDQTTHIFLTMKGNGYARCDYRMGSDGEIYMLEINPNCGTFYPPSDPGSADFCLLNDPIGHHGFLDLIIRTALKHQSEALRVNQQVMKRELVKQEVTKRPMTKREAAKHST